MDNLKSLLDKKEYDLILKITQNSEDVNSLFYRISAFMASNRIIEAISVIENNRKILEQNLPSLMSVHIELLCLAKRFDDAYDEIDYYRNLPYFSQEAEEVLKSLRDIVRNSEKMMNGAKLDEDALIKSLQSDNQLEVVAALDSLRDVSIDPYINIIKNILLNHADQSSRSFALMLLVQKAYKSKVKFNAQGSVIEVNPSELNPPFVGEKFSNFVKKVTNDYKDPTLTQNAISLLSVYIVNTYPIEPNFDDDLEKAIIALAKEYLQIEREKEEDNIEELILKIKGINDGF